MAERSTRVRSSQIRSILPTDVEATNSPTNGLVPSYDLSTGKFTWVASGTGSSDAVTKSISQSSHGFAVGNILRFNGTDYVKAKADTLANSEVVGMVKTVTDGDNFILLVEGYISGLSSLTSGTLYYLSDATAGIMTSTAPTTVGAIDKPLFIAVSITTGYLFTFKGTTIEDGLFDIDIDGNLEPVVGAAADSDFEIDGNGDIQPKA